MSLRRKQHAATGLSVQRVSPAKATRRDGTFRSAGPSGENNTPGRDFRSYHGVKIQGNIAHNGGSIMELANQKSAQMHPRNRAHERDIQSASRKRGFNISIYSSSRFHGFFRKGNICAQPYYFSAFWANSWLVEERSLLWTTAHPRECYTLVSIV